MPRLPFCLLPFTFCLLSALAQAQTRPTTKPTFTYPVDPDSRPQEGVPKGELKGPLPFKSHVFEGTTRNYWLYIPAQYDPAKPACLLVFQDGQRATNPTGQLRIPQVMENLIAKKQMPVTIGLFITPGQRGDAVTYDPKSNNPNNRSVEYDSLNDNYSKMLIDELLPEVKKSYNISDDPNDRAIGGTSSGAICAFTVAWDRPDQFRKVISCIGSFTNIRGGHVYPDLVLQNDPKPIRIYLEDTLHDNPSEDLKRDWHKQNEKMLAALTEKHYDVTHTYADGVHSDAHAGSIMPTILKWLWRDHPRVTAQRRRLTPERVLAIAEPAMRAMFPNEFDADRPYVAELNDGVWHVHGTLHGAVFGGTPEAEIRDADGTILRVYGTQ